MVDGFDTMLPVVLAVVTGMFALRSIWELDLGTIPSFDSWIQRMECFVSIPWRWATESEMEGRFLGAATALPCRVPLSNSAAIAQQEYRREMLLSRFLT